MENEGVDLGSAEELARLAILNAQFSAYLERLTAETEDAVEQNLMLTAVAAGDVLNLATVTLNSLGIRLEDPEVLKEVGPDILRVANLTRPIFESVAQAIIQAQSTPVEIYSKAMDISEFAKDHGIDITFSIDDDDAVEDSPLTD